MWTMSYREYLELPGVKEGIKEVKRIKKETASTETSIKGQTVETGITKIISDIPGFTVKALSPQLDLGFGADVQVSYLEEGKNYSFFADITSNRYKKGTLYLTASGELTEDLKEAFCYRTEYFSVRFGLKKSHASHFIYEKPVVSLVIEHYIPTTGIGLHHVHVIGSLMQNLNSLLMKQGYGARASQLIKPNPKKFPNEYKAYKQSAHKAY